MEALLVSPGTSKAGVETMGQPMAREKLTTRGMK